MLCPQKISLERWRPRPLPCFFFQRPEISFLVVHGPSSWTSKKIWDFDLFAHENNSLSLFAKGHFLKAIINEIYFCFTALLLFTLMSRLKTKYVANSLDLLDLERIEKKWPGFFKKRTGHLLDLGLLKAINWGGKERWEKSSTFCMDAGGVYGPSFPVFWPPEKEACNFSLKISSGRETRSNLLLLMPVLGGFIPFSSLLPFSSLVSVVPVSE